MEIVDAKGIANDKIRTHDLTLEVKNFANQLQSRNFEQPNHKQNNLCLPNHEILTTKQNLDLKSIVLTEVMMINEKHMLDKKIHKILKYNIFVPLPTTEQNVMTTDQLNTPIDIAVEVNQEKVVLTGKILRRKDIAPHPEVDIFLKKVLLLKIIHVLDMLTWKRFSFLSFSLYIL